MSSFLSAAISDKENKVKDLNDRFMMVCLKKMLKNPSNKDPHFAEKVLGCQRQMSSVFDLLAPAIFKHSFQASSAASAGGDNEAEADGSEE